MNLKTFNKFLPKLKEAEKLLVQFIPLVHIPKT